MKTISAIIALFIVSTLSVSGQWSNGADIYNTTSGNVGINTATPQSKLHIAGNNTTAGAPITILQNNIFAGLVGSMRFATGYNNFDSWSGFEAYSAGGIDQQDLRFYTAYGTRNERMRITNTGNVGIGTTNPEYLFQIDNRVGFRNDGVIFWGQDVRAAFAANRGLLSWDDNRVIMGSSTASTHLSLLTEGAERMRITSVGYVGIGNSNPSAKLDVTGNAGASFTNAAIQLTETSANANSRNWLIGNGSGPNYGDLAFHVGTTVNGPPTGTPSIVFTKAGYVGIGNTSPVFSLEVRNTGGESTMRLTSASDKAGIRFDTENTSSGAERNWFVGSNNEAYGDFSIIQSNSIGGNPVTAGTTMFHIANGGNVGIGTKSPGSATKLQVNGSALFTGGWCDPGGATPAGVRVGFTTSSTDEYGFIQSMKTGINYKNLSLQLNGGNVGIGTTSPLAKLDVNGNIFTNSKILIGITDLAKAGNYSLAVNGDAIFKKVRVHSGWADFVFEEKYFLLPLEEVEKFIKANKHLPEVPAAAEVEKDGIDIGSTQAILLQKIEELTLYAIEQHKKNTVQQEQINVLIKELAALKEQQKK